MVDFFALIIFNLSEMPTDSGLFHVSVADPAFKLCAEAQKRDFFAFP